MKSKQLLSVVFSLILVMGVSAGSAFAQTDDDLDDSSMDDDSSEYETGTERDEHEDERDEYEDEHDDKDEYGHD
ncbi:MAG: ABC transporter substrate-binding protein, partial [Nitrosopumilus sp.]|nr:ABC transporter substrate-binding protein [Nitrosopumilus sp.]